MPVSSGWPAPMKYKQVQGAYRAGNGGGKEYP